MSQHAVRYTEVAFRDFNLGFVSENHSTLPHRLDNGIHCLVRADTTYKEIVQII